MKKNPVSSAAKAADHTLDDLKALIHDAEQALQKGGELTDDKLEDLRQRLRAAADEGGELYERACASARRGAEQADQLVRSHPYESLGVALAAGVLLGYFISRR